LPQLPIMHIHYDFPFFLLNTRGPKQEKRKLLASVTTWHLLYAAAVWSDAAEVKTYRLSACRVASAVRTVSDDATLVIQSQRQNNVKVKKLVVTLHKRTLDQQTYSRQQALDRT